MGGVDTLLLEACIVGICERFGPSVGEREGRYGIIELQF
jgi:hypothetical protein